MVASATGRLGERRPCAITIRRSLTSNNSSNSSLTTSTAQPASRSFNNSPRIWAAAPTSTPQVGWETSSTLGSASISRPMMNFCRLPPDRLRAGACGPAALTLKRSISSDAMPTTPFMRNQPPGPMASVRVSKVFWASDMVGTAPRPRRSSGTLLSPRWRR